MPLGHDTDRSPTCIGKYLSIMQGCKSDSMKKSEIIQ